MAKVGAECAVLAAALLLAGCGGGGKGAEGGASAGAPTSAPAPSPSPSPSPSPAPSPAPAPSPSPSPAPAPSPAPSPQVMRGAVLYKSYCSGCHGDDPDAGTQGVYKGFTPEVIEAAYRRVDTMQLLASVLTPANTADIAAFIESRVRR